MAYRDMTDDTYIVICRDDRIGRRKSPYVLATRGVFATRGEADAYAKTVNASRQPLVVSGRFAQLRLPATVGA